jgi:NAD+ diphosphatase
MIHPGPFYKKHTFSFGKHVFVNDDKKPSFWFIFHKDSIALCSTGKQPQLPFYRPHALPVPCDNSPLFCGRYGDIDCYGITIDKPLELPAGMTLYRLRSILPLLTSDMFTIAGRAKQLLYFHAAHKYCGSCGSVTVKSDAEEARTCPACTMVFYPRLSPVVITTVIKDDKMLLARSPHFPEGMYSCIAGFVEPGETVEEAVAREVFEETRIHVSDIAYVTSQQWPFPHSLMLGFKARFDSGELIIDGDEIEDAGWFDRSSLPRIPTLETIAGYLINNSL